MPRRTRTASLAEGPVRPSPLALDATSVAAGPFLKWAGGKGQLLGEILRRLPPEMDTYFEPFVGGGAVFFALAQAGRFRRAVLCDCNKDLVDAYVAIKHDVESVIEALAALAPRNNETDFYKVRDVETARDLAARTARLIYLNKTCFNGLHRVNSKGLFNVPYGANPRATICDEAGLRAASAALQNATIILGDFTAPLAWAGRKDAVYFDPPYVPLSRTAYFTAYAREKFGPTEHERLADSFADLGRRGVAVLLSNSDCPETRRLYEGHKIETVAATRNINSKTSGRGKINEILVTPLGARPERVKRKPA